MVTNPLGNGVYGTSTQMWYLQTVGEMSVEDFTYHRDYEMSYRFVSAPNGDWSHPVCLDAAGGQGGADTVVETYGCDPNGVNQSNQLWVDGYWDPLSVNDVQKDSFKHKTELAPVAGVHMWPNQPAPDLTASSSVSPRQGTTLTLEWPGSTVYPGVTQIWEPVDEPISPNTPAPVVPAQPDSCHGYVCLLPSFS